jgi:hypothetical protein
MIISMKDVLMRPATSAGAAARMLPYRDVAAMPN